jgi:hypothetical protein
MGICAVVVLCVRNSPMSFDLATNITPIIQGVVAILPSFLDLVIAMVPIVITLSIVGFLLGFFDKILSMIKI